VNLGLPRFHRGWAVVLLPLGEDPRELRFEAIPESRLLIGDFTVLRRLSAGQAFKIRDRMNADSREAIR